MNQVGRVDNGGAEANVLPALALRSAALCSAARYSRNREAPLSSGLGQDLLFASLLGRLNKAIGRPGCGTSAAASAAGRLGPASTPPFADLLDQVARQTGVDRALLAAVAEVESGFNPRAVSSAGAKGLMQLMGATAQSLGVVNAFDPLQNLSGGARFLRGLLDRYGGSLPLALAAYNAGPGAVDRHGGVPPFAETQAYVPRVLAALQRYRQVAWGQDPLV